MESRRKWNEFWERDLRNEFLSPLRFFRFPCLRDRSQRLYLTNSSRIRACLNRKIDISLFAITGGKSPNICFCLVFNDLVLQSLQDYRVCMKKWKVYYYDGSVQYKKHINTFVGEDLQLVPQAALFLSQALELFQFLCSFCASNTVCI